MTETRVAIYARFSPHPDQRNESIEDQVRVCREYVDKQHGWSVVGRPYTDRRVSGASLLLRPAIQKLVEDALSGKFDVVLAEDMDRFSRDQEDIAAIYKRIEFAGGKIFTIADGRISDLHVGLKGTMSARYLKDLAAKTHRGLKGRVKNGFSGGGITYGYDVVKKFDADGKPLRGERKINETEAEIVKRIFEEYVKGKSPKMIAVKLNQEGIPGPAGKNWGPSTIYGNRERGTGILNNELYIGRMIWNRLRYTKNPDTGKRVSRLNPESEWIIKEVPELLIVDDALWKAAKEKQGEYSKRTSKLWQTNRPRNLFSYLIKCGECGGGCSMISKTHLGCSSARNKGTCDNRLSIKREKLEQSVFGALQMYLMDEEHCAEFCREYTRYANEIRQRHNTSLNAYRTELDQINRQIDKMVDAIADGVPVARLKEKMLEMENRRIELESVLEGIKEVPVLFHPSMAERYHEEVQRLIHSLNTEGHQTEAASLLRSLIDKIVLTPTQDRDRLTVDLYGDLAGILAVATKDDKSLIESGLSWINLTQQEAMVAGAGFEPATFRL